MKKNSKGGRKMKGTKIIYVLLPILGLLLYASAARAAAAGIAGTKHNLSTSGEGAIKLTAGTGEICVFCHTPHGADSGVSAPLWNRARTGATFTLYSSPSLDALPGQPTGVSLACLSCHDGTVAFDALRNLPGSGGFTDSTSVPSAGWTFAGAAAGNLMPDGITKIGTDLSNDHPISMAYASAFSPSSTSGTNDHTTGFKDPTGDVFSNGVRLYAGQVQCASCHDPHRSDTPTFLRVSNDGSALCLTCHRKDG